MFNRKHCASHTALRACQLLHDSQKRGMSTKYFFSGRKRNRTISLNFCLVLGDRRKRTHIVGKEVIRRVSKQIGEDRVYKTAEFWGYVLYAWTFSKMFYTPCIMTQKRFFERSICYWLLVLSSSTIKNVNKYRKKIIISKSHHFWTGTV